jgi:hypothetical protein
MKNCQGFSEYVWTKKPWLLVYYFCYVNANLTFSQKGSNLVEIYENLNSNEKNAYLMVIPSGGAWLFIGHPDKLLWCEYKPVTCITERQTMCFPILVYINFWGSLTRNPYKLLLKKYVVS